MRTNKLEIEFSADVLYKAPSNTQFVISVNDSAGKNDFWLGKSFKENIKPANTWQKFKSTMSYQPNNNFENLTLKLYFWNDDKTTVWIDNVELKIIRIEHL